MNIFYHKIGCKVTNFLAITQIKDKKNALLLHKYHMFVHKNVYSFLS